MNRRDFLTLIGLGAVAGVVGVKAVGESVIPAGTPLTELYPDGITFVRGYQTPYEIVELRGAVPDMEWLTCPIKYAGKG